MYRARGSPLFAWGTDQGSALVERRRGANQVAARPVRSVGSHGSQLLLSLSQLAENYGKVSDGGYRLPQLMGESPLPPAYRVRKSHRLFLAGEKVFDVRRDLLPDLLRLSIEAPHLQTHQHEADDDRGGGH